MAEAWFQTQSQPVTIELNQDNNVRVFVDIVLYTIFYTAETYLAMRNAATGTSNVLIIMHIVTGLCWIIAICILQVARGRGGRFIRLNGLDAEYRGFKLISLGHRVQSVVMSTHLQNVRDFNIFKSHYESKVVKVAGAIILISGIANMMAIIC